MKQVGVFIELGKTRHLPAELRVALQVLDCGTYNWRTNIVPVHECVRQNNVTIGGKLETPNRKTELPSRTELQREDRYQRVPIKDLEIKEILTNQVRGDRCVPTPIIVKSGIGRIREETIPLIPQRC